MKMPQEPRAIWDARYAERKRFGFDPAYDPWLERWHPFVARGRARHVLELGCGTGPDTRYLVRQGCLPVAVDFSADALRACGQTAPTAQRLLLDLSLPLPFRDGAFPVILASLALHYFPWRKTQAIVDEVRRCLEPGGVLLSRFNSIHDTNHGAVGHREIEPGLYLVNGMPKRFFDEDALRTLFGPGWRINNLEEMTVDKYDDPKVLWEAVVIKD